MDDLPKIYLTDGQHALQMAAWRDESAVAEEVSAQNRKRREGYLEQSIALEKGILAKLSDPPSDKERLWQAAGWAMQGLIAGASPDGVWPSDQYASEAFKVADAMMAEFERHTEGGE